MDRAQIEHAGRPSVKSTAERGGDGPSGPRRAPRPRRDGGRRPDPRQLSLRFRETARAAPLLPPRLPSRPEPAPAARPSRLAPEPDRPRGASGQDVRWGAETARALVIVGLILGGLML